MILSHSLQQVEAFSATTPQQQQQHLQSSSPPTTGTTQSTSTTTSSDHHLTDDNSNSNSKSHYSKSLESILQQDEENNKMSIPTFFQTTWQKSPALFRHNKGGGASDDDKSRITTTSTDQILSRFWNDDAMLNSNNPFQELIKQGWPTLIDLLDQPAYEEPTMVIREGHVQHPQDWMPAYASSSQYAPYINGSSIQQSHADTLSPWLAAFCFDLQRTFPYVYANTYLTPPNSRALNLHADDRDVFVVQLVGSKEWEVMKEIPVPYPYPHEQVGKGNLQVPQSVHEGGPSLTCTLEAGDVLYIPRGHCHHAQCSSDDLSFHVTIAIATFDWTLAGMIHMATKQILTSIPSNKKGLLPKEALLSTNGYDPTTTTMDAATKEVLQKQIDDAIQLLQEQITPDSILNNLQERIQPHRDRAKSNRKEQIERARRQSSGTSQSNQQQQKAAAAAGVVVVGPKAARSIHFDTKLRIATQQEKEELHVPGKRPPPPLIVRDEIKKDVESILSWLHQQQQNQEEQEQNTATAAAASINEFKSLPSLSPVWCDLTWLGFAKQAVEAGVLAVVAD